MKRSLFLLFACLFGALGGVKAYTVDDLTAAGWSLATNLDDITNNVYVFVDAGSSNYIVTRNPSNNTARPQYMALINPFVDPKVVWTIESRAAGEYALRNVESQKYLNTGNEGWNDSMEDTYVSGNLQFISNGNKYDLKRVYGEEKDGWYVGPWGSASAVNINANPGGGYENIPANKKTSIGFYIYKMAKATYLRNYLQQCPNVTYPVDASYLIVNPTIYQGGAATDRPCGWDNWGDHKTDTNEFTDGTGNTKLKAWSHTDSWALFKDISRTIIFDYYQSVSNLPGGKYHISSYLYATQHINIYLYFSDANKNIKNQKDVRITTDDKDIIDGSNTTFGVKANEKHDGADHTLDLYADDFQMQINPYLSTMATSLPADGAMTAGLWYHFNVASAGKYVIAAETLNDIIYATGSTTTLSAAGSNKFTAVQDLEAGDYYVRSSSNNTLTVTSCISSVATELPANGAMEAGKWFYFDVATAGHYDVVATSLANIVYTTNGDLPVDASVASKFSVKNNELSATRYYVKSSSAQTLKWFLTDEKDYTSYITNPSFEVGNKTGWIDETAGRGTPESRDDKIDVISTDALPGKDGAYFAERWWWDSYMNIHQTTQELPAGIYRITALAKADAGEIVIFGKAGNNDEVTQAVHSLSDYSLEVCLATSGTITLGLKGNHNSQTHVAFDNFRLTYVGPYNEVVESGDTQVYCGTITEDVDFTPTAECPIVDITGASFTGNIDVSFAENPNGLIIATSAQKIELNYLKDEPVKNIISTKDNLSDKVVITDGYPFVAPFDFQAQEARYSRTVGASTNFGTICVPFALTSNEDIQYYTTDKITGGVLKLTEVDNVAAGTPAIFKKKNSGATSISVRTIGTAIEKDAGEQGSSVVLKGTFERITIGTDGEEGTSAANGKYYIKNNQFCEGKDWFNIGAFRAYLETGDVNAGARLTIRTDEETAINELKTLDEQQGLKDGKYLIGGKIVVVKEGKLYNVNGVIK